MTILTRGDIINLIAQEARIDLARILPDRSLASLGINSLDVISVLFAIEERCGIIVAPKDLDTCETMGEFVDIIVAKVASS
jgi:acyl carrier protein